MREKCYQCYRPKKNCLCSALTKITTKIKFVILIHPKEAKKERLGTGRIVRQALVNSELIMGVDFTHDPQVNKYLKNDKYRPLLMYPGDSPLTVSDLRNTDGDRKNHSDEREIVVFILDGTWPFAKKMMRKSLNLHNLPRVTIELTKKSNFRIKQQPHELCLSTLEAVVQFLDECEEHKIENLNGAQQSLLDAFNKLVVFQEKCALDPALSGYRKGRYKPAEERVPSKKWDQYGIFFSG